MLQKYLDFEKQQIEWWKAKLGLSDHGVIWVSFLKGVLIGLLIYHFLI